MANHSGPTDPVKDAAAPLNWNWLSARIAPSSNRQLSDWLDNQLLELEETFSHLATEDSRNRVSQRGSENSSSR